MRTDPSAVAFACALATVPAQDVSKVVDCSDAFARVEAVCKDTEVPEDWVGRLRDLVLAWQQSTIRDDDAPGQRRRGRQRTILQQARGRPILLAAGDKAFVETVEGAIQQLRTTAPRAHRVLCTLVRLPGDVAKAQGLTVGRPQPIDEAGAGKVLKAAIAAEGSLTNLPEAKGLPLVSFRAEPAKKDDAKADRTAVDCTVLPVGAREALLEVRVDGSQACTLRLAEGAGALVQLDAKDAAGTVRLLWVRYAGTAPHEAPAKPRVTEKTAGKGR